MSLEFLIDRFDELPETRALAQRLPPAGARAAVAGLPGSSAVVLVAALARRLGQRVFVVLAPTPGDAERWLADAHMLVGDAAALYPQREALGAEEPHFEIAGEWRGDEILSLRTFELDTQRSGEALERITVLPVKTEGVGPGEAGARGVVGVQHAAPLRSAGKRQSLLDLLPTDALLVLEQESAL